MQSPESSGYLRAMLPQQAAEFICPKMFNESGESELCQNLRCMAWQFYTSDLEAFRTPAGMAPGKDFGFPLGFKKSGTRDGFTIWTRRIGDQFREGYCGAFMQRDPWVAGPKTTTLKPEQCQPEKAAA